MNFELRPYQKQAADAAVACFRRGMWNGLLVLPTASGKSWIIADIASRLDAPLLVFSPNREITMQNHEKILKTGMTDVGIYSASLGMKNIRRITLATIGSVHNSMEDFRLFRFVIVDEAHRASADGGMYYDYLTSRDDRCIIGLTATPFRLSSFMGYAKLTFLTRMSPRIYDRVLYVCQVSDMMEKGYLCKPQYFDISGKIAFRLSNVKLNTTGMDYDEKSLEGEYKRSNFARDLLTWTLMSLRPNDGTERNGVLVFTRFVREAEVLMRGLRNNGITAETVTAKTPKDVRMKTIEDFRSGRIKVCCNAGALLEGFDYPALDTVIIASPTRSLTRYVQMCLDMKTEILTKRGFKKYCEIEKGDLVASYKCGEIKFVPIIDIVHRRTYEGEKFVEFSNQHIDFKVTGEHQMLVKARSAIGGYIKQDAISMIERKGSYEIPVSGIENVNGVPLSDDEIRFIAWCISDGSLDKRNKAVHITQSVKNLAYVEEIENCICSCGLRYSKFLRKRKGELSKYSDMYVFCISHGDPVKREERHIGLRGWNKYEEFIKGCKTWAESFELFNEHQFDVFLETIYHADGSHRKAIDYNQDTMSICGGIHKEYSNRLQSLAVRRGYRAKLSSFINKFGNEQFMLRFKKVSKCHIPGTGDKDGKISGKKEYKRSRPRIEISNNDEVWCVKNEIGTIVTRRNGKITIMGNCGRAVRPYEGKKPWVIDLSGNYRHFGKMEDMKIENVGGVNQWEVTTNGRRLTGIIN